jgi:FMN phosphatase YigB (HAD superfamily)
LNRYRIEHFDLGKDFSVFFSSCFLGLRKPDEAIYRVALSVTQRAPDQCLFIDDREVNLEVSPGLGSAHNSFPGCDSIATRAKGERRRLVGRSDKL